MPGVLIHWSVTDMLEKGELDISDTWCQVGCSLFIMMVKNYLMLIDSGPLQFNIWQQQDSASVIDHLAAVYFSRCLLTKLLTMILHSEVNN